MEIPKPKEEKIIKDIRNRFRIKELNYAAITNIINFFTREKETKASKNRILRDITNVFEHKEEENYYKPVRVKNFWSNNCIEYESSSDRNKKLSTPKYLNKIKPYLKDIANNLKKFDTRKYQLIIANNFISSLYNDKERVMHPKSDNIEIMINDEADEAIKKLFDSLKNRYQNNFKLMKCSDFVFDFVHLLYYKCCKTNPN